MISPGGAAPRARRLWAMVAALGLLACAGVEPSISEREIEQKLEQGRGALARGQPGEARALFGQALAAATARSDAGLETDAHIAIAESERELGDLGAALAQLEAARRRAGEDSSDPARLAAVEIALGSTELAAGRPDRARAWLEAGAQRAKETGQPRLEAAGLLDLGTLLALQGEGERALDTFQHSARSAEAAGETLAAAQALANAARVEQGDPALSGQLLARSAALARSLPASHAKASLLISLGERQTALSLAPPRAADAPDAADLLAEALAAADEVGDERAASYALGFLGAFYEKTGRPGLALATTDRALALAARIDAPESVYRWQSQRGRLLAAQGKSAEAIAAYQRAVGRSQSLRHRAAWGGSLRPSSFQSDAAPVYYALIDLLLRQAEAQAGPAPGGDAEQASLRQARDTAEQLRAAELRDYFQDDCVDALRAKLTGLESVSSSALVIYPIALPDRLVVLVGLPSGVLEQYATPVGRAQVEQEARSLRRQLGNRATRRYRAHARTLYDWLIRPMEARLDTAGVDTLVFVPDGALLSIPMATLYDGNQFLVERFALGLTPGLELTDPRPMNPDHVLALIGGVSQGIDGFSPLPNVVPEVRAVSELTRGEVMLDEQFSREALRTALAEKPFSLVHLATHAEFSSRGEGGFLLAWDGRISLDELASDIGLFRFRDEPLELLTLSACDTAQGDDRAALGLSGIAIKAGARSALGTLWSINDPAAESLVTAFYRALLVDGVSRAEALRRAQRGLLAQDAYRHPVYWAPFILIGSWL
ncbi:MAG: CHAT domain-containing protein [Myxococcota bacterium]|nr:CHAT domain-containing protein [Myxococcota bacterium]